MDYGITNTSILLDGVEFKISDALKIKHQVTAPNIHVKDVNVLLQKFNVSITVTVQSLLLKTDYIYGFDFI